MTLLSAWRQIRMRKAISAHQRLYQTAGPERERLTLARLNAAWRHSLAGSPWARRLRDRHGLPDVFEDWTQFQARTPVMDKADLRAVLAEPAGKIPGLQWRSTGGSTAQPLRFPVFESETQVASLDMWTARRRLGIAAGDPLFLIWGHSHLFGAGWRGRVNALKRRLSDAALGYTRWSAYRLSPADLRAAGDALLSSGARYVIGYSAALDRFARANADRAQAFAGLKLKAVIATAEGFPRSDSREAVAATFGCPVVMEYGCVETGPMAYQGLEGQVYDVLWASHRLELGPAGDLIVTCLYPRALPLLRYRIGDLASSDEAGPGLTRLTAIGGRSNESVTLPDGVPIHSEAFTHAVRDTPGLLAYQVVRHGDRAWPSIRYEAAAGLSDEAETALRRRLGLIAPGMERIAIERATTLPASVAGKHRMVVDAGEPG